MEKARITAEQSRAIRQSHGQPVHLVDDTGNDTRVAIVRVELLQTIAGDDFDVTETYAAQETALASVWSDSQLDEYTDQDGSPVH